MSDALEEAEETAPDEQSPGSWQFSGIEDRIFKIKLIIYCHQCGDVVGTASTVPSAAKNGRKHELQTGHGVSVYNRIEADDRDIMWPEDSE